MLFHAPIQIYVTGSIFIYEAALWNTILCYVHKSLQQALV